MRNRLFALLFLLALLPCAALGESLSLDEMNAAEDAGTEWVVVEMDNPSMDRTPLECAAMSAAFVRTLI